MAKINNISDLLTEMGKRLTSDEKWDLLWEEFLEYLYSGDPNTYYTIIENTTSVEQVDEIIRDNAEYLTDRELEELVINLRKLNNK